MRHGAGVVAVVIAAGGLVSACADADAPGALVLTAFGAEDDQLHATYSCTSDGERICEESIAESAGWTKTSERNTWTKHVTYPPGTDVHFRVGAAKGIAACMIANEKGEVLDGSGTKWDCFYPVPD